MNLAITDALIFSRALDAFYRNGNGEPLNSYTATSPRRIWKVLRFSWWMTSMLHNFPDCNAFDSQGQVTELEYLTTSRAAATTLAENYVGLPIEW